MTWEVRQGHVLDLLRAMPEASVQCAITSPPYWGLRSYLPDGHPLKPFEIGIEATPAEYVARIVEVFRELRRVLRPDATLWLNLGDCYATGAGKVGDHPGGGEQGARWAGQHPGRMRQGGIDRPGAASVGPMQQPNRMPLELNAEYVEMARRRIAGPLFAEIAP